VVSAVTRYFNYAAEVPITIKRFFTANCEPPILTKRFFTCCAETPNSVKRHFNYTLAPEIDADMPVGCLYQFAGPIANIPSGFLFCNGASLLRSSYSALFSAIGTTYGYADGTHFYLPDFRDKMAICARQDDSGVPKTNVTGALTASGGSITLTHSGGVVTRAVSGVVTAGGSAHSHLIGTTAVTPAAHSSQGGHTHDNHTTVATKYGTATGSPLIGPTTHSNQGAHTHDNHGLTWGPAPENAHTHAITEPNAGAGHDHGFTQPDNHTAVPPYLAVVYMIKT
jgi:microcystin-dependent protein